MSTGNVIRRTGLRATEDGSLWYKEPFFVVQSSDLRGTKVRANHTRLSCQTYLRQLSKESLSAVRRIFVSCQKIA